MTKPTEIAITLPWPDRKCHPNSRACWRAKSRVVKAMRFHAKMATLQWMNENQSPDLSGDLLITMEFYPNDRRPRDIDNLVANCKSYQDGIFDALGRNDNAAKTVVGQLCHVVRGGEVVIRIARKI